MARLTPNRIRDTTPLAPYRGRLVLTRLSLWAESLIGAFWPLASLLALVGASVLLGFVRHVPWPYLPWLGGALGLVALFLLIRGVRRCVVPTTARVIARLDQSVTGQPLAALLDRPAALGADDKIGQNLWWAHLAQMRTRAAGTQAAWPQVNLRAADPNGIRLMAATALAVALVFGRLPTDADLIDPTGLGLAAVPAASFEAWARPPGYTGLPVMYLSPENLSVASLELPVGTDFTMRLYGQGDFSLLDQVSGQAVTLGPEMTELSFQIAQTGRLTLRDGPNTLGDWAIVARKDQPPTVSVADPLDKARGGAMSMAYSAHDDYGIAGASYQIMLDLDAIDRRYGLGPAPLVPDALRGPLPLPFRADRANFTENLIEDFSQHLFANLPVIVQIQVTDGAGQTGIWEFNDILPARAFFDPLAASLIEQRRDLMWSPENDARVRDVLLAVTYAPEPALFPTASSYLMTRALIRRMGYMAEDGLNVDERAEIAALLWDVAVVIEDGDLSSAAARLRRAQERLAEALENGATESELADLTDELREAIDNYMQQMAREMQENGQQSAEAPQDGATMSQSQLQQLLRQIEELSQNGQRDEARRLLEQLNQFMDNMQMTLQQQPGGQGSPGEGVQDTLRQQQQLSDDAFRQLQEQFRDPGQAGPNGQQQQDGQTGSAPSAEDLARRQEALREFLDQMQRDGTDAEGLAEAERNMADARDRLNEGDLSGALDRQAQAMENLRQGIRDLQGQDRAGANGSENPADSRDPLGRPVGTQGTIDQGDTALPEHNASERARELLDEIRRRAADRLRPDTERDYLQRLLDLF